MDDPRWRHVDEFLAERLSLHDDELDAVLTASAAAGLPAINVAPNQGRLLELFALSIGARRILEIGTLGGYSTLWLARALTTGGELVTLEFDPHHASVARANLDRVSVGKFVHIIEGPALDSLARLIDTGSPFFDMIFIDADKESYPEYFALSMQLVHAGSIIVADNVVRDGAVADLESDDSRVKGVQRFLAAVASDERVRATAVQTVGVKGYDGFAFLVVK